MKQGEEQIEMGVGGLRAAEIAKCVCARGIYLTKLKIIRECSNSKNNQ